MTNAEFIAYVSDYIKPYCLDVKYRAKVSSYFRQYEIDVLLESVDISASNYLKKNSDGTLSEPSARLFLEKIGGIAYNKTRDPVDAEIFHIRKYCQQNCLRWDDREGEAILIQYVNALRKAKYSEAEVLNDLQTEVKRVCKSKNDWLEWKSQMEKWISDIRHWSVESAQTIRDRGSILPKELLDGVARNVQILAKEINSSYENGLYDCTAVMMRRLMEILLIMVYKAAKIENQIQDENGRYLSLDKIIKDAVQNKTIDLSASSRKEMSVIKDIGNFSAHKIWYNAAKQDIEPHTLSFRALFEELLYKSCQR